MRGSPIDRIAFLKTLGFHPRTIVDIGAFRGNWSKDIHTIWPSSSIIMIEADDECEADLKKLLFASYTIALLGQTKQQNIPFYRAKNPIASSGNSVYRENTHFFDDANVSFLTMHTLDSTAEIMKLDTVDFVKIDTQGSELDIIRGGKKTITQSEFVLIETQILEYNQSAPGVLSIMTEMDTLGFIVFDIPQIHYLKSGETVQADLLFVKKSSPYLRRGKMCCDTHRVSAQTWQKPVQVLPKKKWGPREVVFYCGPRFAPWSPKSLESGIGGSEEAVICLTRELSKLGWEITVFGEPGTDMGFTEGNITYRDYRECNWADEFSLFVAWRDGRIFGYNPKAKATYLWLHDVPVAQWYTPERLRNINKIIPLSTYHRSLLPSVPDAKIFQSTNGLDTPLLARLLEKNSSMHRNPTRLFYGSSYDRGLEQLLTMWPEIKKSIPSAALAICYGWDYFLAFYRNNPDAMSWYEKMNRLMMQDGITHHGKVGHPYLENIMLQCGIFAYPCTYEEISCITAKRAQALGCVPVTIDRYALSETVQYGCKTTEQRFLSELIALMENPVKQKALREKMIPWALRTLSWSEIAKKWSDEFTSAVNLLE